MIVEIKTAGKVKQVSELLNLTAQGVLASLNA